MTDYNKN